MAKFKRHLCKSAIRYDGMKRLWDFTEGGIFETDDPKLIEQLIEAGAKMIDGTSAEKPAEPEAPAELSIDDMTKPQLCEYAEKVFGENLSMRLSRDEMIAEIERLSSPAE